MRNVFLFLLLTLTFVVALTASPTAQPLQSSETIGVCLVPGAATVDDATATIVPTETHSITQSRPNTLPVTKAINLSWRPLETSPDKDYAICQRQIGNAQKKWVRRHRSVTARSGT